MKKKYFLAILIALVLLSFSLTLYFYKKYQTAQKILQKQLNPDEREKLIAQVGKLIELPKEEPTIANISDKEKLKDQSFFQNANNGDKVLIFTKAKKAILYRPSINKIIEVSQINLEASSSASVATPTSTPATPTITGNIKLAVYNGTKIKGLAAKKGDLITEKASNFEVVNIDNTVKDYYINMVVNLKKVSNNVIQQLNKIIPVKVVALPKGETAPADADLLLIIGKE
ncbi:MAG: LytR C-terminal domain-containing protein [Patescibacteria group bacterium]